MPVLSSEQFTQEYKKFQVKIHQFVVAQNFAAKTAQYVDLFNQMSSVAPDDMKEYIQKSPEFLAARNQSLELMERIVALHQGLEALFKMDEATLAKTYGFDLAKVDEKIASDIKSAAILLHQFNIVSERGRKAIERTDNPFFSQTH